MVMAAAAAASAANTAEAIKRANERWGDYAKARGHTVREGHAGWSRVVNPLVQGHVDGVAFTLEYVVEGGSTLALATPVAPLDGNVEVTLEGVGSRLAKLFGAQDIQVGHKEFDAKYLIKGSPDSTAKGLLSGPICELLMPLDLSRLAYDHGARDGGKDGGKKGGLVMIERLGLEERPATLDGMAAAVVALARVAAEPQG